MRRRPVEKEELRSEGEQILSAIQDVQRQLSCATQGFEMATDETMIDGYIFEIQALHKKYEFFLKQAKAIGLTVYGKQNI